MPRSSPKLAFAVAALVLAVGVLGTGCGVRLVRQKVYEDSRTKVVLRQHKSGGEIVAYGYSHPAAIAPVRLAHVLSRLDVRMEDAKGAQRQSALPTEALYVLADHIAVAFSQADPTQEIAVYYIERTKRWGIFDRHFLYSFVTYMKDDALYVHLSRVGWEIPKQAIAKNERLPEPRVGKHPMKFRIVGGTAMAPVDSQSLAILWRDDVFKRPTRTRIGSDGQVVRRTILMESETEEVEAEPEAQDTAADRLPESLSAATLRALADLEEERSRGEVTEAEYNLRRLEIIRADPASQ